MWNLKWWTLSDIGPQRVKNAWSYSFTSSCVFMKCFNCTQVELYIEAICCVAATDWSLAAFRPIERMCLTVKILQVWFLVKHEELC
jgi:hypothetical protein